MNTHQTHQNPPSVLHSLAGAYRRGELSKDEYEASNAVWVADNLREYRMEQFNPLLPMLRSYCEDRIAGGRERDPAMALRLGSWAKATRQTMLENVHTVKLLMWCADRLDGFNLDVKATNIRSAIADMYSLVCPERVRDDLRLADQCLAEESLARMRTARER